MSPKMMLDSAVAVAFHEWYADDLARSITYLGVPIMKWIGDLWNYQEIIVKLRPALVVEFGTACGGSALWFADLMREVNPAGLVYTVDVSGEGLHERAKDHPFIKRDVCSSLDPDLATRLLALRQAYPGPVFAILDSDHHRAHVLAEMMSLRPVLTTGDYLVVEDGNLHGHPIWPGFPEGPYEAIAEYVRRYPEDYECDAWRETRFGFTFAPRGYLRRR